ncbi:MULTISPECIES: terpene synthase family protein [Streptomyces]|uniref:terpene synthase family protein n=1 Tax=Streptomyces TaxID=1883 RepID=UPI003556260F
MDGRRPYRGIREAIADIMCWINDVHCLHLEQAAGEPVHHVTVLQRAEACARGPSGR